MARPRQFDSVLVEQALLDVFWTRGYARTSIDNLTAATGLLRGSLYAAFGDKEGMFLTAVDLYVADLAAELATEKTGLLALQHVLDTVVKLTARDPKRRGCLILNAIPEAHVLADETQKVLQGGLDAMRTLLRTHLVQARGEAGSKADLESLVALVLGASVSIRVLGRAGQNRRLLQNISKGALEAACRRLETN